MAGEGDRRPSVASEESAEGATLDAKKRALVRVVVGVPMFAVALFGAILAYRVSGRPLHGSVFWLFILAVVVGFFVYSLSPFLALIRKR